MSQVTAEAMLTMDMQRALIWMEYETQLAEREQGNGGWLSDHGEAMAKYDKEYMIARGKLVALKSE